MLPSASEWRYLARGLRRAPAFTLGVVGTLALALAAAIAAFTLIDRVMLRALPVRDPEQVVLLSEDDTRGNQRLPSYPTVQDWQRESRAFGSITFMRGGTVSLGPRGERESIIRGMASPGFAKTLGITAILGRAFTTDEEGPSGAPVAVLVESAWTTRFGRDPGIIGRSILLDDRPTTVVGVIPESQRYPEWAEVIVPLEPFRTTESALDNRLLHVDSRVIARLAPGMTVEAATRDLAAIQRRLAATYPDPAGAYPSVQVLPLRVAIVGNITGPLRALGLGMSLMLLLACVNLAGLALVRQARGAHEAGVRLALGAGTARLVRQVMAEWVLLAALAGILGIAIATGLVGLVRATPGLGLPRATELHVDVRVMIVAFLASILAGVLIAIVPCWRLRAVAQTGVRTLRGSALAGREARGLRVAVTATQMALAIMLLTGAALLLRSLGRMRGADTGYVPDGLVAIDINPPPAANASEAAAAALFGRALEAVRAIPGVERAAFVNHMPLGGAMPTRVSVPGVAPDPGGADVALYKTASEDYAAVMGLRLVRGRWFSRAEVDARGPGVVISERVANQFWPGADPIGRSLTVYRSSQARPGFGAPEPSTVLGVVADVRHFGPAQPGAAEVYLPWTREVWGWGSVVVKSALDPTDLRRQMERAIRQVEPDVPFASSGNTGFRVPTRDLESFFVPRRLGVLLASGVAALATIIASLGLYALVSYGVSQRTGEFGVRLALGASPAAVRDGVMREGWRLVALGSVLGVAGALALGRLIAAQLVDTSPRDPLALAVAVVILSVVLTVALWIPAQRAARLSPTEALRSA